MVETGVALEVLRFPILDGNWKEAGGIRRPISDCSSVLGRGLLIGQIDLGSILAGRKLKRSVYLLVNYSHDQSYDLYRMLQSESRLDVITEANLLQLNHEAKQSFQKAFAMEVTAWV